MYETYKKQTDKMMKALVKTSLVITATVLIIWIVLAVLRGIEFATDLRISFLWAIPIYYWVFDLVIFLSRNRLLNELNEENVEVRTIRVKRMSRYDRLTYSTHRFYGRGFNYGILKYKIRDTLDEVYYFEDIIGGERILPKVKSCEAMKGKTMEITFTKKTHYIVAVKFDADKDTNFFKREMEGYFV